MEKKSIKILDKKNLLPFVLVSSLFALWGFANNLTDPMVQAFKKVLELSNSEAAWIQMAFYGGYFSMAFPAALLMKKYSYKLGIIIGLSFYSIGLAIPFILSGYLIQRFLIFSKNFRKNINLVSKIGGIILLITGILILTNQLQALGYYLLNIFPFLQNFG